MWSSALSASTDTLRTSPVTPRAWRKIPVRGIDFNTDRSYQPRVTRAAFLYPWFPETWTAGGAPVHGTPSMGRYSSTLGTFQLQILQMQYARIGAAIVSWWGPTSPYDPRLADVLKAAEGTGFKVGVYYEQEGFGNPDPTKLKADLDYLKSKYFSHPNYWHIDRKPVVFSYGDASDGAGMCTRWAQAAVGIWYSLKVFNGYQTVSPQPSAWHQYAPDQGYVEFLPWSVSVSPGFWFAPDAAPRLARDSARFEADVAKMTAAKPQIQLITTFNEWGEGTAVEPELSRSFTELEILRRYKP